jgi:hydrogenase small subunit
MVSFFGGLMRISRRDFIKLAGALGVASAFNLTAIEKALGGNALPRVIWLQGQSCTGCSISLLNSVNLATIDDVLINKINLEYHSNLIASAGDVAMAAVTGAHPGSTELLAFSDEYLSSGAGLTFDMNNDGVVNLIDFAKLASQGFILVVEGAIPTGSAGKFCEIGGDMTMIDAFDRFSSAANQILAVGTCASFGGIPGAAGSSTGALGVEGALAHLGRTKTVINIPGCPMHPDWFVGTVLSLLSGQSVPLDSTRRPTAYFGQKIHEHCQYYEVDDINALGQKGCLEKLGCRGERTYADCFSRKWNNPALNTHGVNWCIGAGSPCTGCVQKGWPDAPYSPFFAGGDD